LAELLNYFQGPFEALGVIHRPIHLPLFFNELTQWTIVIRPLLCCASRGGHDRLAEFPITRFRNEFDQESLGIGQSIRGETHVLVTNAKKLSECFSICENPCFDFSNRYPEEKVRMFRHWEPFSDQLWWTNTLVEVSEDKKGGSSRCLIESPNRFLEVAKSTTPIAIPHQIVSPGLSQNRAQQHFAEDVFNRKAD
jgi:hypothetical protein